MDRQYSIRRLKEQEELNARNEREEALRHYGVKGMKWGVRRFQPYTKSNERKGDKGGVFKNVKKRRTAKKAIKSENKTQAKDKKWLDDVTKNQAGVGVEIHNKSMEGVNKGIKRINAMDKYKDANMNKPGKLQDEYYKDMNDMMYEENKKALATMDKATSPSGRTKLAVGRDSGQPGGIPRIGIDDAKDGKTPDMNKTKVAALSKRQKNKALKKAKNQLSNKVNDFEGKVLDTVFKKAGRNDITELDWDKDPKGAQKKFHANAKKQVKAANDYVKANKDKLPEGVEVKYDIKDVAGDDGALSPTVTYKGKEFSFQAGRHDTPGTNQWLEDHIDEIRQSDEFDSPSLLHSALIENDDDAIFELLNTKLVDL